MRLRMLLALILLVINSLWLAHVFLVLALQGHYNITESVQWAAYIELVLSLAVAGLAVKCILDVDQVT